MGKQRQQIKNKLKLKEKENSQCLCQKNCDCLGSSSFLLDRDTFFQFIFAVILSLFRCFLVSCFSNTRTSRIKHDGPGKKKLRNGDLCLRNCIKITNSPLWKKHCPKKQRSPPEKSWPPVEKIDYQTCFKSRIHPAPHSRTWRLYSAAFSVMWKDFKLIMICFRGLRFRHKHCELFLTLFIFCRCLPINACHSWHVFTFVHS